MERKKCNHIKVKLKLIRHLKNYLVNMMHQNGQMSPRVRSYYMVAKTITGPAGNATYLFIIFTEHLLYITLEPQEDYSLLEEIHHTGVQKCYQEKYVIMCLRSV